MSALAIPFIGALGADGAAADRAGKMGLYAWLVGAWEMDAVYHPEDGSLQRGRGEIHAAWRLEGRAIQDVWIVPPRAVRHAEPGALGFYGTTLRVYDPGLDAWHIVWTDPVKQAYLHQIGRARGTDIVQEGPGSEGATLRWSFIERTPNSFHWLGERSTDGGKSWRLQVEFFARRAGV